MLISIYLAVLIIASYWVIKTLAPEMAKPPLPRPAPKAKPVAVKPQVTAAAIDPEMNETAGKRIEKLEILLAEKNKNITLLQNDLRSVIAQVYSFDKLKKILEEENHRLKEQNRIFRSELGLPAAQQKENSIT